MIRLVATEGELTVVRRLAGYSYGEWTVEWPDSVPEDQRPILDDDRVHGYVHRLGAGSGRMGRRFVRADVTITAAEYDQAGAVPNTGYSDVEDVLDAAVSQTDEDALVERAITRDGLGAWRPGTDFRVGDMVTVSVWGRSIVLPVTAIEAVTEAGAVIDWRVTVGGQLVADDVERRRSNAELERAVWQERRERLGEVGRVSAAVGVAQSTADTARDEAQHLRDTLAGAGATEVDVTLQLEDLNAMLQAHGEDAPGGLIPAYIAANTQRWRLQDELDAAQDKQIRDNQHRIGEIQVLQDENSRQLQQISDLNAKLMRLSVGKITMMGGETARSVEHGVAVRMPDWDRNLYVVAADEFVGTVTVQLFYSGGSGYQRVFHPEDFRVGAYSKLAKNEFFDSFARANGHYRVAEWYVDLGDIGSATVLVDHTTWTRGVLDEQAL